jgi:hypothetical protein
MAQPSIHSILNESMRGIDVAAKLEVYGMIGGAS